MQTEITHYSWPVFCDIGTFSMLFDRIPENCGKKWTMRGQAYAFFFSALRSSVWKLSKILIQT